MSRQQAAVVFDELSEETTAMPVAAGVELESERSVWSESETQILLAEYKSNEQLFKSSAVRNSSVWKKIAHKVSTHTPQQCENKLKYLKSQYIKRIESSGPKNTGGTIVKCPYFEDLDAIFGKRPNIVPVAVASSSRGKCDLKRESSGDEEEPLSCGEFNKKCRKKKSMLQKQLEDIENRSKEREAAREARHKESMQRKDAALKVFSDFCNNYLNIIKKENGLKTEEDKKE